MRFIHTADWHLGRLFHNVHLTEDQAFTLAGLVRLAEERQVDAVLVAGDVFDRAIPPTDAVDLLDDVVAQLALDRNIPVVMIAGNHDSPARLEYFAGLARRTGVHVVGRVGAQPYHAEIIGADGVPVRFWPLAYTDPETARAELRRDDIHSHEGAMRAQLECISTEARRAARNVLVAHAFVSGCVESESERPLTIGGSGVVSGALFDGFDYVALGHLHRSQPVGGQETIRYAGSIFKYSFEEAEHQKSVTVVDVAQDGAVSLETVPLPFLHDVRRIRGSFDQLQAGPADPVLAQSYVEVILTDREPILNPAEKLKPLFPNLLSLRREESRIHDSGPGPGQGIPRKTTAELFQEFFAEIVGEPMTGPQESQLSTVVAELERTEREPEA